MNCRDCKDLLDGYVDGELDLVNHLRIEEHLKECSTCEAAHKNIVALKASVSEPSFSYKAPAHLRERLRAADLRSAPLQTEPKTSWWKWRWMPTLATAAVLAVALAATWAIVSRNSTSDDDLVAKEIVSAHVRSMMEKHLMDVPSTDQHTVKPWFDGRLDFSPPVVDLAPQGFALIGGRLDYASGRAVAALVYQRRQHYINLFVYPAPTTANVGSKVEVLQGFNLIHWSRSGMVFWAVSDLNVTELQEFSQDLQN